MLTGFFHERIRAITNPSFAVGRLNWKKVKKEDEEVEDEQSAFLQFSENHCSCIFYVLLEYYSV